VSTRLLVGDCRDLLRELPADSVHCVVTSPPYFGLRDYGTGTWEGGEAGCSHAPRAHRAEDKETGTGRLRDKPSNICHCGAHRVDSQIGLEPTPDAYVAELVAVFREVRRVLRPDGTCWLNLGDSYLSTSGKMYPQTETYSHGHNRYKEWERPAKFSGLKPKDLIGIPWRVAFALQMPWLRCRGCGVENHAAQWATFPNGRRICPACEHSHGVDVSESGWWLRSDIIWAKSNPMPESVRDRPTKAHEYVFLLTKSERYFYDADAIAEPVEESSGGWQSRWRKGDEMRSSNSKSRGSVEHGQSLDGVVAYRPTRNARTVWTIATQPFAESHFAVMPPELAERCIKAGSRPGDTVLDPFAGAGTTLLVADRLGRDAIGIELNADYADLATSRLKNDAGMFAGISIESASAAEGDAPLFAEVAA
jgi:DNA modification methylase